MLCHLEQKSHLGLDNFFEGNDLKGQRVVLGHEHVKGGRRLLLLLLFRLLLLLLLFRLLLLLLLLLL